MSDYYSIIIETYKDGWKTKARPIDGEAFPSSIHVECSKKMRADYPVGTRFRVQAKLTSKPGKAAHLYTSYKWPYEVM